MAEVSLYPMGAWMRKRTFTTKEKAAKYARLNDPTPQEKRDTSLLERWGVERFEEYLAKLKEEQK